MGVVELHITSNFTFLTGASHPEEYAHRAAEMGLEAFAIADKNSVAGIVRAHVALRDIARIVQEREKHLAQFGEIGPHRPEHSPHAAGSLDVTHVPRLLPAARVVLVCGLTCVIIPRDRQGWRNLCRLLSKGRMRAPKGECHIRMDDLLEFGGCCALILVPQAVHRQHGADASWTEAEQLTRRFAGDVYMMMSPQYDSRDTRDFLAIKALAQRLGVLPVASTAPLMHHGRRRQMADVLSSIREGLRIEQLGGKALANAEQRLRSAHEVRSLFAGHSDAIENATALAHACTFSLDELRYEYPSELVGQETAAERLARLATAGLRWRYPAGVPQRASDQLAHELRLIDKLGFAPYFLTVHDIVAFARDRGILCQGRGSAANSITCYALGVTSVSPEIGTMVFERFVSEARNEPPDIDVDFEHERREEVIQHIYERYGRHRAGLCATVIHYRGKRAVREVGRAMGLSEDTITALSSQIWGFGSTKGLEPERFAELGLDATDRRLQQTFG